jgi:hypothetical protein
MSVASIFGGNNKVANSLVAARGSNGPFANALASARSAMGGSGSNEASQAANQLSYNQSLGNVQSKLTSWFQAAGVDTSGDIQLIVRSDGTVALGNDPADAEKIQEVLNNHPEINGMMQSLANSFQRVNPTSSSSDSQFTLTLAAGQATGSMQ